MIYHFAIDETGSFTLDDNDKSFVCGILVSKNENGLKQGYKRAFEACGFGKEAPNDTAGLIGGERFHFSGMSDAHKKICRETLTPLIDKVIVSKGKPLLCANNQGFWFTAVVSVIYELLNKRRFQNGDELKIEIDNRADKVWGLVEDTLTFSDYHNILKSKIDKFIKPYRDRLGIRAEVRFIGDTKSFFVNLADLACGFSRTTDMEKTECRCENYMNEDAPLSLIDKNPIGALTKIFQETMNSHFENTGLIQKVFKNTKHSDEYYNMVWDVFRNFLQYNMGARYEKNKNTISKLNEIVDKFRVEFKNSGGKLPVDRRLDVITSLMAYYSHAGAIETPVDKETFINALNETGADAENRVTRKWEKYVSFCLREAQIQFNGYNFGEVATTFEEIWVTQKKIIDVGYKFDSQKDEHTGAIIGTLAQSYAFDGNIDDAIEYCALSKEYVVKTSKQTDSYLLTLYFIKQDIENVRRCFQAQTGETPETFAAKERPKNEDVWKLLSYAKLRALELYKNGETALPEIDARTSDRDAEYPYPLVLKWAAVAKHIENPEGNRSTVSEYLNSAAATLLKEGGKFAIRTLALPVVQVYALTDNTNPYHAKYNSIADSLKTESPAFADFVEKKAPLLNKIKNDADIWERANALPFNYS